MVPDSAVTWKLVPVAAAYCTLQPDRSTAAVPRLNSSMKSLVYVAPELPPPPYTWLIVTSGEAAWAMPGVSATAAATTTTARSKRRVMR